MDSSAPTIHLFGFKSQAHHLRFYGQIVYSIWHCIEKKDENKQKEDGFGTYFYENLRI